MGAIEAADTLVVCLRALTERNPSRAFEMFCSGCGMTCIPDAKFCHKCGKEISDNKGSCATEVGGTPTGSTVGNTNRGTGVTSFNSYRARKQDERSRFFKTCGTKAKKTKVEDKQPTEVKINVGIMVMKDGKLSVKRGATLPLTVAPSAGPQQLLTKAIEKHSRFNNNLINRLRSYRLLYADVKEVTTIPGSQEPFTLQRYKEEIDKPYSRITFFLCWSNDYLASTIGNDGENDSSDDELTYSIYHTRPTVLKSEHGELAVQSVQDVSVINVEASATKASTSSSTAAAGLARGSAACEVDDEVSILCPKPQHIQCPICLDCYPFAQIETHADNCSMWLLEEDEFSCEFLEPMQPSTTDSSDDATVEKELPLCEGPKKMLIRQISQVGEMVMGDKEPKRLTVRRKFIWQDFKNAVKIYHQQKKISPTEKVKVVFSGEPAVDDGGPRRELFSGMNMQCTGIYFIYIKFLN